MGILSKKMLVAAVVLFSMLSCTGMPKEFPAPDFSLKDILTGKEIKLSDFRGQPVLLYFFASW